MIRTGEPVFSEDISQARIQEFAADEQHLKLMEAVNPRSAVLLPLNARGRVLGGMTLVFAESGQQYIQSDLPVLQELARRSALAVDNARLYKAAREANEERDRLAALVEHSSDLIAIAALEDPLRLTYVNPAALRALGVADVKEMNRIIADSAGPEYIRELIDEAIPVIADGKTWIKEGEARNMSTGESFPVHRHLFPIKHPETGELIGLGAISRNIRELKRIEEDYRIALAEKQALVTAIRDLYHQELRRANQFMAIHQVTTHAVAVRELEQLLPDTARIVRDTFDYYLVGVWLLDSEGDGIELRGGAGRVGADQEARPVPLGYRFPLGGNSLVGWVAQSGESLLVNDVAADTRYSPIEGWPATGAKIAAPIRISEDLIGVLDLSSDQAQAFDEADRTVAETLAGLLGVAIQNARLFDQNREMAVVEERNRLAREIHDAISHGLTGIIWQLTAAEGQLRRTASAQSIDMEPALAGLSKAQTIARDALSEARRTVQDLRESPLEGRSLPDALRASMARICDQFGLRGVFEQKGHARPLATNVEIAVFRICQEAVANAGKHALASSLRVILGYEDALCLTVCDDGKGFFPPNGNRAMEGNGFGLTSMHDRARLVGGQLEIRSEPEQGTTVKLTIPSGNTS